MHLEKLGQQGTSRLGHVPAGTVLDLRDVRLADALALLLTNRLHQLQLRHRATQFAKRSLDLPQVANFLRQRDITDRDSYIANCNTMSSTEYGLF